MVQSPSWEANWFAASQEIPRYMFIAMLFYRVIILSDNFSCRVL